MLPARGASYRTDRDPHFFGLGQRITSRTSTGGRPPTTQVRPRDTGLEGDNWRNILLDTYRRRGVNFFGV